jgi:hypothetical protein
VLAADAPPPLPSSRPAPQQGNNPSQIKLAKGAHFTNNVTKQKFQ